MHHASLRNLVGPTICRALNCLSRLLSWAVKLGSGLSIRQVQLLLGRENLQTTGLYRNYYLDEMQRAAAQVNFGLTARLAPP